MTRPLPLLVLLLLTLWPAQAAAWCRPTLYRDYQFGPIYKAMLLPDECTGNYRVRKVSNTNPLLSRPGGLPEFSGLWGWSLGGIPNALLWTLGTWHWEHWDGTRWQRLRPL